MRQPWTRAHLQLLGFGRIGRQGKVGELLLRLRLAALREADVRRDHTLDDGAPVARGVPLDARRLEHRPDVVSLLPEQVQAHRGIFARIKVKVGALERPARREQQHERVADDLQRRRGADCAGATGAAVRWGRPNAQAQGEAAVDVELKLIRLFGRLAPRVQWLQR